MRLYRLTPIDLSDLSWERSRHTGAAIIRAENERQARLLAMELWETDEDQIFINPWSRPSFSSCEELPADGTYALDGEPGVLDPDPASIPRACEHSPSSPA